MFFRHPSDSGRFLPSSGKPSFPAKRRPLLPPRSEEPRHARKSAPKRWDQNAIPPSTFCARLVKFSVSSAPSVSKKPLKVLDKLVSCGILAFVDTYAQPL